MLKFKLTIIVVGVLGLANPISAQESSPPQPKAADTIKKSVEAHAPDAIDYAKRRAANSNFHDEISSTVFLSKASFYTNKRWMTKADIPERYPYMLDAIVSPYFRVSSNNWNYGIGNGHLMFSLYFNPDFEVRIFENQTSLNDESHPVRTASFRPGGELFVRYNKKNPSKYTHIAFSLKGNHHSDGQDGPEFNEQDQPWGKKGYANTYNGDFSDDFLIGVNTMVFHKSPNMHHNLFAKLGFSTSTSTSVGLAKYNVYGTQRINLLSSWAYSPDYVATVNGQSVGDTFPVEKLRLEFYGSYITNPMNVGPIESPSKAKPEDRFNFHLTTHFRIRGFSAAGFYLEGGYYGQDLYNIYYQQASWFYKFGLSFGLFKYTYPEK